MGWDDVKESSTGVVGERTRLNSSNSLSRARVPVHSESLILLRIMVRVCIHPLGLGYESPRDQPTLEGGYRQTLWASLLYF